MTEAAPLLDGVAVQLGRREFIVPPLNLRAVRKVIPLLPVLEGKSGEGSFLDAAVELLALAIQRNYPDITKDEIEELVDLGNLPRLVEAVMAVSGFGPKGKGEPPAAVTPEA